MPITRGEVPPHSPELEAALEGTAVVCAELNEDRLEGQSLSIAAHNRVPFRIVLCQDVDTITRLVQHLSAQNDTSPLNVIQASTIIDCEPVGRPFWQIYLYTKKQEDAIYWYILHASPQLGNIHIYNYNQFYTSDEQTACDIRNDAIPYENE